MNIIQTEQDFLSFIRDQAMSNGNLSIRGVARCCDVPHTSVIRDGVFASAKLAETFAINSFEAGALIQSGFPPQAVWLAIEYFAYESKAIAPMAKQLARTFGSIGVKHVVSKLTEAEAMPAPEQSKLGSSVETTVAMLSPLRSLLTTLPAALIDGFLLNEVQKLHPEIKTVANAAHSLLAANTAIPEILLTPTAIGEQLGVSARVVNKVLVDNGYQTKNPSKSKTQPAYLPTEKGKPYSSNTIATGRATDNTSYQHIKWSQSIVEVARSLL